MQIAIDHAFKSPQNNDMIKAYQNQVQSKGEIPTADEIIKYATLKSNRKMQKK